MKKGLIFFAILSVCAVFYIAGRQNPSELQQAITSGEMIRLHVVAASDDAKDQETKLYVRDAILKHFGEELSQAKNSAAVAGILSSRLNEIEKVAGNAANEKGYDGPIAAIFGEFDFPERIYAGEVVPAGRYDALRVVLGDGGGANWWCVMYPRLCFVGEEAVDPGEKIEVRFDSSIASWWKSTFQKTE